MDDESKLLAKTLSTIRQSAGQSIIFAINEVAEVIFTQPHYYAQVIGAMEDYWAIQGHWPKEIESTISQLREKQSAQLKPWE